MSDLMQADIDAAKALVLEMKWTEAIKFLRDMSVADGLRDAMWRVEDLAQRNPNSELAQSLAKRPK